MKAEGKEIYSYNTVERRKRGRERASFYNL
jgi:hypothetical protein